MSEFESIKSYEPSLLTTGFIQREDLGVRVRMIPFEDTKGTYVKTEDYIKLLNAYQEMASSIQPQSEKPKRKGKQDINPE